MLQTKIKVAKVFDGKRANNRYTTVESKELEELRDSKERLDDLIMTATKFILYTSLIVTGVVFGAILL